MAGKLVQVATETVSSSTASVTLTGINTDDVYMVAVNGLSPDTAENLECRVTESGTANSTANYDFAGKGLKTSGTFENNTGTNATQWDISDSFINATTEKNFNAIIYIFNANNSSEYTFITFETSHFAGSELYGNQGGAVFTSTSSVDGLLFQIDSSNNIDSGTFTLFRCV